MAYPVSVTVAPLIANRNRLTTAFRLVLAIPHLILVGGIGFIFTSSRGSSTTSIGSETGLLGAVIWFLAMVSWFSIVITGTHITGIRQFTMFFVRWRGRALAYLMLLEDQYPPFGDMAYPVSVDVVEPAGPRNRVSVGFRLLLAIPHFIVLCLVLLGWSVTTIVAWFAIVIAGTYPQVFYDFGVGALRWYIRVEAYMLLLVDEYPPFSFE